MSEPVEPLVPTWSVGELHEALNGVLVHVFGDEVWVEGELRNFKRSQNQHVYFDLVDSDAESDVNRPMLAVTLFSRERQIVNRFLTRQGDAVRMGDGIRVRIRGTLNVYAARSTLQLRMTWIDPAYTLGVLGQERDRVLAALSADGVLRANARIELPAVPLHVALVTSVGSAAHADALDELRRSTIGFRISVIDARTQGPEAAGSIVGALETAQHLGAEVVLLVRGGGARTDLAAFDTDEVARAIVASRLAVLTGIGHEIDRTVADEVAHTAHKTPTAAAAAVVESARRCAQDVATAWVQLTSASHGRLLRAQQQLDEQARRAGRAASTHLRRDAQHVDHLAHRLALTAPRTTTAAAPMVDDLARRLRVAAARRVDVGSQTLEGLAATVRAHDPAVALARGWTITRTHDGRVLRSITDVAPGEQIVTVLADGTVHSTVSDAIADPVPAPISAPPNSRSAP